MGAVTTTMYVTDATCQRHYDEWAPQPLRCNRHERCEPPLGRATERPQRGRELVEGVEASPVVRGPPRLDVVERGPLGRDSFFS